MVAHRKMPLPKTPNLDPASCDCTFTHRVPCGVPTMKPPLRSFLRVCLMAVLLVPATATCAAEDVPAPDYQSVVASLFKEADTCRMTGHVVDGTVYFLDRILTDDPSLQKLKQMFLAEKPRYLGREVPPLLGQHSSSRLEFTWKNVEQKEVGRAALLEGDRLLINGSLLFTLSTTPGEKNLAFLRQAAYFANPMAVAAPAGTPSYRRMISGYFARAVSCKITGYHSFRQEDRTIDYTTPDAAALQALKRILLRKKALYLREIKPREELSGVNSRYRFTWLDAQGTPVGHAELADRHTLCLGGHSLFSTNTYGIDYPDLGFFAGITRFVDPTQFPPPQPDYHSLVQALFSKAASCRIQGSYAPEGVSLPYDVDFTAADASALQALKEMFLFERPDNAGRDEGGNGVHITSPSRLHFTWKDAQGMELGGVSLLNEDRLEFEATHDLFCTSENPPLKKNITLLTRAARFALPRQFARLEPPRYQDLVQGLSAKAAACRIKGCYTDVETDTTHDVDRTVADAAGLQALQQTFLAEKPDYRGICICKELNDGYISVLHFFWTDAQGKPLGHVALLNDGPVLFEPSHDLFITGSTLLTRMAHLALPAIDAQPRTPESNGPARKE